MSEVSETRQPLSFEAALSELQRIVAELEDGRVGLEESLERFERGIALLKTCHQVLEHAEQRIEVLVGQKSDGTPVTQPFDASATADVDSPSAGRRRTRKAKFEATPQPPLADSGSESDTGFLF